MYNKTENQPSDPSSPMLTATMKLPFNIKTEIFLSTCLNGYLKNTVIGYFIILIIFL